MTVTDPHERKDFAQGLGRTGEQRVQPRDWVSAGREERVLRVNRGGLGRNTNYNSVIFWLKKQLSNVNPN